MYEGNKRNWIRVNTTNYAIKNDGFDQCQRLGYIVNFNDICDMRKKTVFSFRINGQTINMGIFCRICWTQSTIRHPYSLASKDNNTIYALNKYAHFSHQTVISFFSMIHCIFYPHTSINMAISDNYPILFAITFNTHKHWPFISMPTTKCGRILLCSIKICHLSCEIDKAVQKKIKLKQNVKRQVKEN